MRVLKRELFKSNFRRLLLVGESNSSVSSTLTPLSKLDLVGREKRVRFDSKPHVYRHDNKHNVHEAELWYSSFDIDDLRSSCYEIGHGIADLADSKHPLFVYRKLITKLRDASKSSSSSERAAAMVNRQLAGLDQDWMIGLGLELKACRKQRHLVRKTRHDMWKKIEAIQNGPSLTDEKKEKQIRAECEHITSPARVYASHMAKVHSL